ncbi:MAG: PspC domain-containing protein [Chitinophagaceae bacterium]|nr:PspC domain-containing protein [Chitinophagaceae bacterium]
MKKIININLSGRVIPIEDSAYEKLQSYIESLRRYFAHEDGRDEIINDIESRIAELMNEKVRKGAASITEADVEEIAASMGRPEDFDADTTEPASASFASGAGPDTAYTGPRARRRLYRDSSDKFIGGVCSGIAHYLNTDPAIIRILFAIITFGGFGLGFLIYILLWMILPARDIDGYTGKRLYRNPDDRVIGGVAGGLSAYFNMKASTLRLIFAAPIVLSILFSFLDGLTWRNGFDFFPNIIFGSLSGTFMLAYIILWIVLPEANGPYEKMEMRGEKVDVNTIRQNVKDGMGSVKDRVQGWSEEVKESAQNLGNRAREFANTRGKTFAAEVGETARRRGGGIGHAIGVIFKVFFFFIAGTIAFSLFVALIALLFGGVAWWPINNFLWTSKWQQLYAWGTLIFFLCVPLIGFIVWVVRRIMRVRSRRSYLGWTFGFLWTIGWVAATLLTASLVRDHREHEHSDTPVSIAQPAGGKMIVTVSEPELSYTGRFDWINDGGEGWDLSTDTMKLSNVDFDFQKSPDSSYHVTIKRYSFGSTPGEAMNRADKIEYRVISRDSVLDLGSGYAIDSDSKFRWQHVVVDIMIPVGKKIRFARSVNDKLNQGNFDFKRDRRYERRVDRYSEERREYHYYSRYLRPETDYVMEADGQLNDASGRVVPGEDYRYNETDSVRIQKAIEFKKQELKELEEKQQYKRSSTRVEQMDDEESDAIGSSTTPVFAMVKTFF